MKLPRMAFGLSDFLWKYLQFISVAVFAASMGFTVYMLQGRNPLFSVMLGVCLGLSAMVFTGLAIKHFNEYTNRKWHDRVEKQADQDLEEVPAGGAKIVKTPVQRMRKVKTCPHYENVDELSQKELDQRFAAWKRKHQK